MRGLRATVQIGDQHHLHVDHQPENKNGPSSSYIVDLMDVISLLCRIRETLWPAFLAVLEAITQAAVIPTFIETALWGAFTLLIITSTCILSRRGSRMVMSRVVFPLTVLMYIMSTIIWAVDFAITRDQLSRILPAILQPSSPATLDFISEVNGLVVTALIATTINIIVGDSIILWRMCVVWSGNKIVIGISLILGFLTAGFYIAYAVTLIISELHAVSFPGLHVTPLGIIVTTLSFVSNIFATGMIAFKFWQHRRHLMKELRNRSTHSAVEGVLILLIESGVMYTTLWALYITANTPGGISGALGASIYFGMQQVIGMYPTLLVVVIAAQKSKTVSTPTTARPPSSPVSVILTNNPPRPDTFYVTMNNACADIEQRPLPPLPKS